MVEFDNPMVWMWSLIFFIIVMFFVWKTSWSADLKLWYKLVYTVVAAPAIFAVVAIMSDD